MEFMQGIVSRKIGWGLNMLEKSADWEAREDLQQFESKKNFMGKIFKIWVCIFDFWIYFQVNREERDQICLHVLKSSVTIGNLSIKTLADRKHVVYVQKFHDDLVTQHSATSSCENISMEFNESAEILRNRDGLTSFNHWGKFPEFVFNHFSLMKGFCYRHNLINIESEKVSASKKSWKALQRRKFYSILSCETFQ